MSPSGKEEPSIWFYFTEKHDEIMLMSLKRQCWGNVLFWLECECFLALFYHQNKFSMTDRRRKTSMQLIWGNTCPENKPHTFFIFLIKLGLTASMYGSIKSLHPSACAKHLILKQDFNHRTTTRQIKRENGAEDGFSLKFPDFNHDYEHGKA